MTVPGGMTPREAEGSLRMPRLPTTDRCLGRPRCPNEPVFEVGMMGGLSRKALCQFCWAHMLVASEKAAADYEAGK